MRQTQSNNCTDRRTGEYQEQPFARPPRSESVTVTIALTGSVQDIHLKPCPRSLEVEAGDDGGAS